MTSRIANVVVPALVAALALLVMVVVPDSVPAQSCGPSHDANCGLCGPCEETRICPCPGGKSCTSPSENKHYEGMILSVACAPYGYTHKPCTGNCPCTLFQISLEVCCNDGRTVYYFPRVCCMDATR
jgi:hypothetical protein